MVRTKPKQVEISDKSVHDILFELCKNNAHKTALINGETGQSYTYHDIVDIIKRLSSGFNRLGIRNGDIVALFLPNCPEYIFSLFAIFATGAAATLPNPSYTSYEFSHGLKLTGASWMITHSSLYDKALESAKEADSRLRGVIVIDSENSPAGAIPFSKLIHDDGSWFPDVPIDSKRHLALIPFSSGTTGLPKGVMISHYNIVAQITVIGSAMEGDTVHSPDEQAVVLSVLPLYHVYGLLGVVMLSLFAGHKVVMLSRFHPQKFLGCIAKYRVTVIPLVPPIIVFLSKSPLTKEYDLSSVRRYNCGAAPLSHDSEVEFQKKFKNESIRQGFGMTETTLCVLFSYPTELPRSGSSGKALPNTEIEVIDVDSQKFLGANQRGEVVCRGPQIMMGYFNNLEATKATIDSDGWLHTGDIGYYDEDGYFYIVERIKELIKYKGFQVAPAELESLLLTHPQVDDAAVIGIPDEEAGEIPKAFIVIKPGTHPTEQNIKQFVADKMSHFKHLRGGVEFVDKIPKSEAGKILRRFLRNRPAAVPQHKL